VTGNRESEAEQAYEGADQALGLPEREAEHGPQCQPVRIARAEYSGCTSRVVRGSAVHAAIASSVNQTGVVLAPVRHPCAAVADGDDSRHSP